MHMTMIWWIAGSVLYLAVSCLFLYMMTRIKRNLSERNQWSRERVEREFGSFKSDLICSLLWPFHIIGMLVYGMKG